MRILKSVDSSSAASFPEKRFVKLHVDRSCDKRALQIVGGAVGFLVDHSRHGKGTAGVRIVAAAIVYRT